MPLTWSKGPGFNDKINYDLEKIGPFCCFNRHTITAYLKYIVDLIYPSPAAGYQLLIKYDHISS